MNNNCRVLKVASLMVFLSAPLWAVSPAENSEKEDQIKSIVQEIFTEHGFPVDKSNVVLIEDNGKLTVALDISNSIASTFADLITTRVRNSNISLKDTLVEVNLFGAADGSPETNAKNLNSQRWNDVLSAANNRTVVKAGLVDEPMGLSMGEIQPGPAFGSSSQSVDFERARSIILSHLLKIKQSGKMGNTILMESYWKEVFDQAQASQIYETGRPLITQALVAGIKPYREGKPLDASVFADLALKALGMQPVNGVPGASVTLFGY